MTTGGRLNVANAIKKQFPVKITSASADVTFGAAPLSANFSASVQYPAVVEKAWWSFDDADDVTGYSASRTYQEEGAYMAWFHALTVDGVESKWPVQIVVADPGTIVYINDNPGFGREAEFLQACEAAELKCVVVDPRYPLGLPQSFDDRMLAWNTSFSWSDTLLVDQEEYLAGFLDGGGRLFMISPEYLYDLGLTPFAEQYLHVLGYVDNIPMGYWDGIDGDPITDGMSITGVLGAELEDALFPDLNAKPILKNEDPASRYGRRCGMRMKPIGWSSPPCHGRSFPWSAPPMATGRPPLRINSSPRSTITLWATQTHLPLSTRRRPISTLRTLARRFLSPPRPTILMKTGSTFYGILKDQARTPSIP